MLKHEHSAWSRLDICVGSAGKWSQEACCSPLRGNETFGGARGIGREVKLDCVKCSLTVFPVHLLVIQAKTTLC
jgi:hypothetical protein